jgi:hypothetical protein
MNGQIILSCYLTQREDAQSKSDPRPARWPTNCDATVHDWIGSIRQQNLDGFIFHDQLSEGFIAKWENADDHILFLGPVEWQTPWTAVEERVRIYRDFLFENRDFNWVLTTDLSDVEFFKNPFELMTDPKQLYIGSETNIIGCTKIMCNWMQRTYGEITNRDKPILNPGICGGHRKVLLPFLDEWLAEMGRALEPVPTPPHDIVAFNRVLYRGKFPYTTGWPLHTTFQKYETADYGAAIRHK